MVTEYKKEVLFDPYSPTNYAIFQFFINRGLFRLRSGLPFSKAFEFQHITVIKRNVFKLNYYLNSRKEFKGSPKKQYQTQMLGIANRIRFLKEHLLLEPYDILEEHYWGLFYKLTPLALEFLIKKKVFASILDAFTVEHGYDAKLDKCFDEEYLLQEVLKFSAKPKEEVQGNVNQP